MIVGFWSRRVSRMKCIPILVRPYGIDTTPETFLYSCAATRVLGRNGEIHLPSFDHALRLWLQIARSVSFMEDCLSSLPTWWQRLSEFNLEIDRPGRPGIPIFLASFEALRNTRGIFRIVVPKIQLHFLRPRDGISGIDGNLRRIHYYTHQKPHVTCTKRWSKQTPCMAKKLYKAPENGRISTLKVWWLPQNQRFCF